MPRLTNRLAPVFLALALLPAPLAAQGGTITSARAVLDVMGAQKMFLEGLESAIPAQQKASPQVPQVFWDRLLQTAKTAAPSFIDSLAPIYAAEFTEPELQQLKAFYESPLGQKVADKQPSLMLRTQELGYRWGIRLGTDVAQQLADEGVTLQ